MFSMILAMDNNGLIGKENSLPWNLPEDLQHFKNITSEKIIVMGKNTYDSIGRPLPNRENIVITTDINFKDDRLTIFNNLEDFFNYVKNKKSEIIIIGGANLIKQLYSYIDTLYITHIEEVFEGDCYIDFIDFNELRLIEKVSYYKENGAKYNYSFCKYKK